MPKSHSSVMFAFVGVLAASALLLSGCAAAAPAVAAQGTTGTPGTPAPAPATAPAPASSLAIDTTRTITVVGHGEVTGKPEVARSSIGIEVLAPTVGDAMAEARTRMDAVIKALKAAGIADKDLQTSSFSISFERQGTVAAPAKEPVAGATAETTANQGGAYRVNNMVNVTIRDLDKVSTVLDAAVNAGANNVWGINFSVDDTANLEAQAREKAVSDARTRAESLAKLTGVNVGPVVSVSEVIGSPSPKYAASAATGLGGGGTPVEPGEISYSTDIQVVYAIR